MKKLILRLSLFLCFCSVGSVKAQWVSIPDTNFGTWLNTNGYSTCLQGNNSVGWQMDTSCPVVVNATSIDCGNKDIHDIEGVQYFKNIWSLYCDYNQLDSLPPLPVGLTTLICTANFLTNLPPLPLGLTYLSCSSNQLTSLPTLPPVLHDLLCDYNQLSNLPPLPNSLVWLDCFNNQLSSLPVLPNGLIRLACYYNQLVYLPALPNGLIYLHCHNNLLTSLPELPDSLDYCMIKNNPITCLPNIKHIGHFYFSNTLISCLPNYGNVIWSQTDIQTLSLCQPGNPNSCSVLWNISGSTYYDGNLNCLNDTIDLPIGNVKVRLWNNNELVMETYTTMDGKYSFDTDSFSTYTISIDSSNLDFAVRCPIDGIETAIVSAADSFQLNRNFGLDCKPGFDIAAWSIEGRFRPLDIRKVDIHVGGGSNFYGINCSGGIAGSVTVVISGPVSYYAPASGALTPDNVGGNILTYNIADFGSVNFNNSFNIIIQTDTNAVLGSLVCFTVSVTPITGDNIPTNNVQTHCFTVVNSFDPNEKEVYPAGNIDTAQKWLTYTIHFQNTGTAEAQHIYVTDTLDSNVDPASFQLLAYSHQPMVQIKENAVRFNFPNINLPDSNTNEPLSHGYVQYKVKLKENLPVGTNISNTAFIYFDFNSAVVTNTVSNTISTVTNVAEFGMQNSEFRMNPNPSSSSVNISVDESMIGSSLTVYDVTGRKMAAVQLRSSVFGLSTSNFSSGIYFVTVENEKGRVTKKLVIEK